MITKNTALFSALVAFFSPVVMADIIPHGESCGIVTDVVPVQKSPAAMFSMMGVSVDNCSNDWSCYPGSGTESDPYLVTVGAFISPEAASELGAREIEKLVLKGVDNFNIATSNFPDLGFPHVRAVVSSFAEVPHSVFTFGRGTMDDDYYAFWNTSSDYITSHSPDVQMQLHPYPDETGFYGLAGGLVSINLSGVWELLEKTIPHEMGHVFGAGHQVGAATWGGLHDYSHAAACELEDGTRISSIVSAWEHESRILRFSDPSMACGEHGVTENAKTVAEMLPEVAKRWELRSNAGTVSMTVNAPEIAEGQSVELTLVRDGDTSKNAFIGVWVEGLDKTQLVGNDYRYVEFKAGENTVTLPVSTNRDGVWSDDHEMKFTLGYPVALTIQDPTPVAVAVKNIDDPALGTAAFTVDSISVNEGDSVLVEIARENGSDGTLTVSLVSEYGTATAANMQAVNETITFAQGEDRKTVTIQTLRDNIFSESKTAALLLTDSSGNSQSLTVSIKNIDKKPAPEADAGDSGGAVGGVFGLAIGLIAFMRRRGRN